MKKSVLLAALLQTINATLFIPLPPLPPLPPVFHRPLPRPSTIACDSPEVEEAARAALELINAEHHHGYKYALNTIRDNSVLREIPPGESHYKLFLELLETRCHVVNPTPAEKCDVRLLEETRVEASCAVMLHKAKGVFHLRGYKCTSAPDSPENVVRVCPDCPFLLPLNDAKGLESVKISLEKFNRDSNETAHFKLMEVGRISAQDMFIAHSYFAEFAIVETDCTDQVKPEDEEKCVALNESQAHHGFCKSTVLVKNGNPEDEKDVTVNCDVYDVQNTSSGDHMDLHHEGKPHPHGKHHPLGFKLPHAVHPCPHPGPHPHPHPGPHPHPHPGPHPHPHQHPHPCPHPHPHPHPRPGPHPHPHPHPTHWPHPHPTHWPHPHPTHWTPHHMPMGPPFLHHPPPPPHGPPHHPPQGHPPQHPQGPPHHAQELPSLAPDSPLLHHSPPFPSTCPGKTRHP
ncbi:alpha-2-HS-glycoprotein 1 [Amia ocellicauda]|uniref:alpha-2-HS-glycoprotein 1 n=1 Tax=Amia ocellicauda TaxID=2972642 RepID=UPI00346486A6